MGQIKMEARRKRWMLLKMQKELERNQFEILQKTIEKAKAGNMPAIREYWNQVERFEKAKNKKNTSEISEAMAQLDNETLSNLTSALSKVSPKIKDEK